MAKQKQSHDPLYYGLAEKMDAEQRHYFDALLSPDNIAVFCNASAGTGKTTLAVGAAKYLYETGKVGGLVYVFAPVEESVMGFRPGSQEEKEHAYTFPLRDALAEVGDDPDKATDEKYGWVKVRSHTFMRGTNLENKFVLLDEVQNFTIPQLRKVFTRIHDNCKVAAIGHTGQTDIKEALSGFTPYIEHFRSEPYATVCTLSHNHRGQFANHADKL